MARKNSGKPWLHGASGWWCTTVAGKRRKLDKDYRAACWKLKSLLSKQKRGGLGTHDWLDVSFAALADEYLTDSKARKKPTTYESRRYRLLRALRSLGTTVRVGDLRRFHLAKLVRRPGLRDRNNWRNSGIDWLERNPAPYPAAYPAG